MPRATFDGTMASCHSDIRDAINKAVRAGGHAFSTDGSGQRLRIQCLARRGDRIMVQRPRLNTWEPLPAPCALEWRAATASQTSCFHVRHV